MSTPDSKADHARRFAERFNAEEARATHPHRLLRELRRRLFPDLSDEDLDALDAAEPPSEPRPPNDAIGFFTARR